MAPTTTKKLGVDDSVKRGKCLFIESPTSVVDATMTARVAGAPVGDRLRQSKIVPLLRGRRVAGPVPVCDVRVEEGALSVELTITGQRRRNVVVAESRAA